jgi:hypothetical protein
MCPLEEDKVSHRLAGVVNAEQGRRGRGLLFLVGLAV